MTRPDPAMKMVERFPKTVIAQMGHVENHSQPVHFGEQLPPAGSETAGGVSALRVDARPVVRGTERAKALGVRPLQMAGRENGVRAFEAEDVADRQPGRARGGVRLA